ncbi:MAG: metal ABC transporter permease [Bifidobacteriaceae bacterium]|jgi:zinc/manganese transport system permease protein|nr:metal ABC transporter permease [Bifidobacteriaceae bacterium]
MRFDIGYTPNWAEMLGQQFIINSFLCGTIVALSAGIIGYFVIIRNSTFASHALSHIGLPGATGAILLGIPVSAGLFLFCGLGAITISFLGKKINDRDIATGSVLALATGFGLLFANMSAKASSTMTSILFGNIFTIYPIQTLIFFGFLLLVITLLFIFFRPLLLCSLNEDIAEAKGLPIRIYTTGFMIILSIVVAMSIEVVGTLLLFALVITPAAAAIAITANPIRCIILSCCLAVFSVWSGLLISIIFSLPPSFAIVAISFSIWFIIKQFKKDKIAKKDLNILFHK